MKTDRTFQIEMSYQTTVISCKRIETISRTFFAKSSTQKRNNAEKVFPILDINTDYGMNNFCTGRKRQFEKKKQTNIFFVLFCF